MPLAKIADLNGSPDEVRARFEQAKQLGDMYNGFANAEEGGRDRAPGIHASELYPCLRKAVYSVMNTPRQAQVSKFWRQRFKVGHAIHGMLQSDFHAMAKRSDPGSPKQKMHVVESALRHGQEFARLGSLHMSFEDEIVCSPAHQELARYYNIHSACDGIFTFRDEPEGEPVLRVGLEIKTASPGDFEKMSSPKHEHIRQAHIYMACLDLPLMWFFYMNKGNQNNTPSSAPYLIHFDPQVWREVESRCRDVLDLAEKKQLPERTETIVCEFCPYAYTCQPNTLGAYRPRQERRQTLR